MTNFKLGNILLKLIFILSFTSVVHAEVKIGVTGSCEQLRTIIQKGKSNLTATDSIVFMAYRALANGQVTIYNQALLAAGYKIPLVSDDTEKPDIFFLKRMSIACAQESPELGQYTPLVTQNIAVLMAELYTHQKIELNFRTLLEEPLDKETPYSKKPEIGLGGGSCQVFSSMIKRSSAYETVYRAWLMGYLIPYVAMKELEPEKGMEMVDDIYLGTTAYCKSNPEVKYAKAILDTFREVEDDY